MIGAFFLGVLVTNILQHRRRSAKNITQPNQKDDSEPSRVSRIASAAEEATAQVSFISVLFVLMRFLLLSPLLLPSQADGDLLEFVAAEFRSSARGEGRLGLERSKGNRFFH